MVYVGDPWSFSGGDSCFMGEILVESREACKLKNMWVCLGRRRGFEIIDFIILYFISNGYVLIYGNELMILSFFVTLFFVDPKWCLEIYVGFGDRIEGYLFFGCLMGDGHIS